MNDDSTNTNGTQALVFKVLGEPASKANSRKMVLIGGSPRLIKSSKALSYASAFKLQAKPAAKLLTGDVAVHIRIWYASRRPDLDESLILDLLQDVAYENDRQVKEKHIYWGLDKENPRCEIRVEAIDKK
jgi:Holliday junction resolvase RusA-like endonuclease